MPPPKRTVTKPVKKDPYGLDFIWKFLICCLGGPVGLIFFLFWDD